MLYLLLLSFLLTFFWLYMGIWSHERYISVESDVGSLQSTDALSGHVDVTIFL